MPKENTWKTRSIHRSQRCKSVNRKQEQKLQVREVDLEALKVRCAAVVARHVDPATRTVSEIDPSEYHVGMNTWSQRQFADKQLA